MFKSERDHCFHQNDDEIDIKKCDHIQRILNALKYYKTLKLINDNSSQNTNEIFIDFCDNAYIKLLNDYQHIIAIHEQHLEEINKQILNDDNYDKCEYSQCNLSRRYHSSSIRTTSHNGNNNNNIKDPKLVFYREMFDAMHNYLWHLYDQGMRIQANVLNQDDDKKIDDEDQDDNKEQYYVDKAFGRIISHIRGKREKYKIDSDRFGDNNINNKFKLNTINDKKVDINQDQLDKAFIAENIVGGGYFHYLHLLLNVIKSHN